MILKFNREAFERHLSNEMLIAAAIGILATYLMLVNLDYATLWHDEGVNAIMASNLANVGALSGWDGRNLFIGSQGSAINNDFYLASYPPWPAISSALGVLLFGKGEFAIRFPHAMFGVFSLVVFYLLLLLNFPHHKRLRLLAFTLFALSPIVILYMRQGRYYADAIFFTLLAFYCYQQFWRSGKLGWLCGLTILTVLNFLNHFAIGVTAAIAVAMWHPIYYWRETSLRQWLQFLVAGTAAAVVCGAYLFAVGIIGDDSQLEYSSEIYKFSWLKRHFLLLTYYLRDVVKTGWVPFWVAAWWLYYLTTKPVREVLFPQAEKKRPSKKKKAPLIPGHEKIALRWAFMALLLITVSAFISVQPATHSVADMRYMVLALPFILVSIAVFVDWAWQQHKFFGGTALVTLLAINFYTTSIGEQNFSCPKERFTFSALLGEIHRPYPSAIAEAVTYLQQHAKQDDTILVRPWQEYSLMVYYMGDKLIFLLWAKR